MFDVLSITGTIFVLIALGYLSVRAAVFAAADLHVLGKYVINLALPALIFRAVASQQIGEIANAGYLGGYLIGSLAVLAGGYLWSRRVLRQDALASTFQSMGMSCTNTGFIGYPIVLMALPAVASTALALNMIVENLVLIPLILVLAERAKGGAVGMRLAWRIARRLAVNPIILALAAGLAVTLTGTSLPVIVSGPVDLIAASSAAVSLLVIGGTLAGLPLKMIGGGVASVVVGKLVLHPVCVWVGLGIMEIAGHAVGDEALRDAAVLIAATPAMALYPILAQRYGQQGAASLAMLTMTLLSFPTLSAVLYLL